MRTRVALRDKVALLNPLRFGLHSWQLFSHKWLRYLAPIFQLGALASNATLIGKGLVWSALFVFQALFYLLAAWGFRAHSLLGPLSLPFYLCLVNAAAARALVRFLRGEEQVTWPPRT